MGREATKEGEDAVPRLEFEESLKKALLLVREFRLHCITQQLDQRAIRVALKFQLMADSQFALKILNPQEEEHLDELAHDLLRQAIENAKKVKH